MSWLEVLSITLVALSLCAAVVAYYVVKIGSEVLTVSDNSQKDADASRKLL